MSNQAVQRRTTKGGMGERGGRGGRTERMGDEEKEEERENQDGSRKKTRQETWTMRRKSRGSPSGRYRSAQKRLIKSFREVKKKKKKDGAGWTDSQRPSIHQTNLMKAGRTLRFRRRTKLIGCSAKDAHLSASAWQSDVDPSLTSACVCVCVVKPHAIWLRSPWLQGTQLGGWFSLRS